MNTMLQRYFDLGWPLLPCWPKSKRGVLRHDQASADPQVIKAWAAGQLRECDRAHAWRHRAAQANWAVVLGEVSGLLVLDVEGDAGDQEMRRRRRDGQLPLTPQCNSGGFKRGYHLYFRRPRGVPLRGKVWIHPEIEARVDRHLILVPPSVHDKTGWSYAWETGRAPWEVEVPAAPDWLIEQLRPLPRPERSAAPTEVGEITERYIAGALRKASDAVAAARNGGRNDALNAETFGLARLLGPELSEAQLTEAMLAAALAAGLEEREALGTIRSAIAGRNRRIAA